MLKSLLASISNWR